MADARYAAAGQQSDPLTRFERLVRFLGNGAQFAIVKFDCDFKAGFSAHAAFDAGALPLLP